MNIICVDDEPIVLEEVRELLEKQPDVNDVKDFLLPKDALCWLQSNQPDAAFLDINMGQMNGLELAKRIRELYHDCAIVFITGYSEYAVDAFSIHADGYLLKPATLEDVRCELDHIKSKKALSMPKNEKRIRIQCFGNFEVFADEIPLHFKRSKTKELLAYLVDRQGCATTMRELTTVLWEDSPNTLSVQSNLRNLIHDLLNTFSSLNAENIIIKDRNTIALNCASISCDFYDFQRRIPYAVNLYRGEYMSQYSWAEIRYNNLDSY